jgi:HAD superfamily hydrolase (TIGR01509 family)
MWSTLLWDHDGVLVDTEALYFQATREILAGAGVELSRAQYRQLFLVEGKGAFHLVAERGVQAIEALRAARDARYAELLAAGDLLIPGALALLARLRQRFRMAIVTSSKRAHFELIHRQSGLPAQFELILTREDYVRAKPEPEPYLRALQQLGLAPAQCLVIEDSERGLRAAKAAGLACWVVPSELTRDSEFAGADRRFDDLAALERALLERSA